VSTEKEREKIEIVSSHELKIELDAVEDGFLTIYSKIPSLDKATEGFRLGELIVISGPTKNGKTLFAQSLTAEFVKQNHFPLWFTYEVPPKQFFKSFPELPLFYLPKKLITSNLGWLISKMDESFKKYHTRAVFIDHLHYLFDMARVKSPSIEIGTIIRRLKTIAVSRGYIIFLLCHTRKGASDIQNLSYESIRDSSFVSQESDCVLMLARDIKHPESNEARLRVEFHRRTGVLNYVINLAKLGGYLREKELRAEVEQERTYNPDAFTEGGYTEAEEMIL